jgi:autotransporter translocation and assembly factor TamB
MPFSPETFLKERKIAPSTPFAATVKLPPSSAAFLAQFVPEIRYSEGKMSVDASATGTFDKPVLSGGILMDLSAIRFQNADLPGIGNFHGDLRFAGDQLTFRRFQGDVAGGPFAVTGRAKLENLLDPQLDLRLRSEGTLLVRNDSLTLRADSDLRISGPLNTAQVTGNFRSTPRRSEGGLSTFP